MARSLLAVLLLASCSTPPPEPWGLARQDLYLQSTIAHELGHAGGMEHSDSGIMRLEIDPEAKPTPDDWAPRYEIDCLAWSVPNEMREPFEVAAEAWCIASGGEFCPWPSIATNAPGLVEWARLDSGTLGLHTRDTIQISTVLRGAD